MNQFKKDELTTRLKGAGLLLFILLGVLYCTKAKGQSVTTESLDTSLIIQFFPDTSLEWEPLYTFTVVSGFTTSKDTTEVAYVILKQVRDSFTLDEVYRIDFPYVDTFFGYLIQRYKPYRVEYYDLFWRPIDEEDILHIKKRKKK